MRTPDEQTILTHIYREVEKLGGDIGLLTIIGSFKDTLSDKAVADMVETAELKERYETA